MNSQKFTVGKRREADPLENLIGGTRRFSDRQPAIKISEYGVQPRKHRCHLFADPARPDAHLLQRAVFQRSAQAYLVIDQLCDCWITAKMPEITGDRNLASGVQLSMPMAQVLASQQTPLAGSST